MLLHKHALATLFLFFYVQFTCDPTLHLFQPPRAHNLLNSPHTLHKSAVQHLALHAMLEHTYPCSSKAWLSHALACCLRGRWCAGWDVKLSTHTGHVIAHLRTTTCARACRRVHAAAGEVAGRDSWLVPHGGCYRTGKRAQEPGRCCAQQRRRQMRVGVRASGSARCRLGTAQPLGLGWCVV